MRLHVDWLKHVNYPSAYNQCKHSTHAFPHLAYFLWWVNSFIFLPEFPLLRSIKFYLISSHHIWLPSKYTFDDTFALIAVKTTIRVWCECKCSDRKIGWKMTWLDQWVEKNGAWLMHCWTNKSPSAQVCGLLTKAVLFVGTFYISVTLSLSFLCFPVGIWRWHMKSLWKFTDDWILHCRSVGKDN